MKRTKRRARQRSGRYTPPASRKVTSLFGTGLDVENLKQGTHDRLIMLTGSLRASGVSWLILTDDDALEFLDKQGEVATPVYGQQQHTEDLQASRTKVTAGHTLVVALCEIHA